jgi:phosphonopyruvate decarboxylase
MMKSHECLEVLARLLPDQVVVATYRAAFEWMAARPSDLNYLSVGAMGLASSHGLGLALGRPDRKVIVLDGDGYAVNGGHPIPGAGRTDFAGLARAAGYRKVLQCRDTGHLADAFPKVLRQDGPAFVDLRVEHAGEVPLDYDALFSAEHRRAFKAALDRV